MYQDSYILPNKEIIRLSEISKIGKMKDRGEYKHNISLYKWNFQIIFNNGDIIDVEEPYFYSDWGDARMKLEKIRNDLIQAYENYKNKNNFLLSYPQ